MSALAGLSWSDRGRAAEAALLLALGSVAIRLLPFRWVVRAAGRLAPRHRRAGAAQEARALARIVEGCANRLPWRTVCFQRGLAAHVMLRRRGIPSVLHYGAEQDQARGLSAHVWVVLEGEVVVGARGLVGHVTLARFPADAAG